MVDSKIWDKLQMSYAQVGIKCATVFILKGKEKYEKIHIVPPVGVWIISERQKLAELAISQKRKYRAREQEEGGVVTLYNFSNFECCDFFLTS